ncbi:Ldh family oxidoreductase [Tabrizicola sp.]|uniref:Ldh family oxidoreductase n=1 Tax=Tabrizicola sp. TaxID=2005166 RepID=UPI00286A2E3C|nr:Ldh family oxidoreductase [Tabrizicola sp.]
MQITLDEVEAIAQAALQRAGASVLQAGAVARSIRAAEAEGTRAIGLGYLQWYVGHLKVGKILGQAVPVVSMKRPGMIHVDAAGGFAHPAYEAGEAALVTAARSQGIAVLGVAGGYACGVLGYFSDRLAREGLVSIAVTNASSTMAPWGGSLPFFGTNPWAFGAPRTADALVIDSSSSATAFVNLATAAAEGRPIPVHWALDRDGNPTTNAAEGMAGSIAPSGGHKGAALALMVEILAAGLTGANWSFQASSLGDDVGGPPRLGQSFIAIDPEAMAPGFGERLEVMVAAMCNQQGVRVPGARRIENRKIAEKQGVALDDGEVAILGELTGEPVQGQALA